MTLTVADVRASMHVDVGYEGDDDTLVIDYNAPTHPSLLSDLPSLGATSILVFPRGPRRRDPRVRGHPRAPRARGRRSAVQARARRRDARLVV